MRRKQLKELTKAGLIELVLQLEARLPNPTPPGYSPWMPLSWPFGDPIVGINDQFFGRPIAISQTDGTDG